MYNGAHSRDTRAYLSPSSAVPTTASHPLSSTLIYRPRRPSLLRPLLRHSTFCSTFRSTFRSTFCSTLPSAFRSTSWPRLGRNLGHHVPHTIQTYPRRPRISERAGCCRAQARYDDAQRYSLLSTNADTAAYRCGTRVCQLVRKPGIKHRRGANRTPRSKRRAKRGFVGARRFPLSMEISAGSTRFEPRAEKRKRGSLYTKESDPRRERKRKDLLSRERARRLCSKIYNFDAQRRLAKRSRCRCSRRAFSVCETTSPPLFDRRPTISSFSRKFFSRRSELVLSQRLPRRKKALRFIATSGRTKEPIRAAYVLWTSSESGRADLEWSNNRTKNLIRFNFAVLKRPSRTPVPISIFTRHPCNF